MAHFISDKAVLKAARVVIKCRHFLAGSYRHERSSPVRGGPDVVGPNGERGRTRGARIDTPLFLSFFNSPVLRARSGGDERQRDGKRQSEREMVSGEKKRPIEISRAGPTTRTGRHISLG